MSQGVESVAPAGEQVPGLSEAEGRFGTPLVRDVHYAVSRGTWLYWRRARRRRAGEVVLLLRRRNGRYLVHTKAFYPQGVYRLPSGGIKPGEDLVEAVRREAAEETSLEVDIEAFLAVVRHHFHRRHREMVYTSYLFLLQELGGTLRPADAGEAITGFREVTLAEVVALADELEALPADWREWGRFRAAVHRVVGEVLEVEQGGSDAPVAERQPDLPPGGDNGGPAPVGSSAC